MNAFGSDRPATPDTPPYVGLYFNVGAQGWQREALRHGTVAVLDPGTTTTRTVKTTVTVAGTDGTAGTGADATDGAARTVEVAGTVRNTTTVFSHTGTRPSAGAPAFGDYNELSPNMAWGTRATLGYSIGDQAIEFTGFYIFQNNTSTRFSSADLPATNPGTATVVSFNETQAKNLIDTDKDKDGIINSVTAPTVDGGPANQSRLDLPFFNEPTGFKGLWLQAQNVSVSLQSELGSAEANYRTSGLMEGLQLLAGIRYVDVREQFALSTDDEPVPTPTTSTLYQTETHNHLIAGQLGCEWWANLVPWFAVGATAKGAWGVNMIDTAVFLQRGDGLVGIDSHRSTQSFGQVYEVGLMGQFRLGDSVRLRGGYSALWLLGVATAADQVDYDLAHTTGQERSNGHLFYHGPMIEVLFSF
jgi:hypothetical protein